MDQDDTLTVWGNTYEHLCGGRLSRHALLLVLAKDEALRDRLDTHLAILKRQGVIDDWHDRRIMAGTEWERQIDDHLEAADIILLLISANFVASNYCYGREMTRALERHDDGHARVIPVILRPSDWQSAPFGRLQALPRDGKPVTSWKDRDRAFTEVARGVRAAAQALRQAGRRGPRTDRPPPSSPKATDLLLETGTVPIDSRFYVTRTADHDAARHLDSTQPTVIVKGCRQAGKSSLMARLHHAAIQAGQKSCYLNLQDVDEASLKSSGTLFRELARMLADALETDVDPDDTWSDRRGVKQNLTGFLEKAVLTAAETPLLHVLDEADLAFTYPDCRTDLFSVLRSWHNRRATDARGRWSKLRLVIAHATDPGLWIADPN